MKSFSLPQFFDQAPLRDLAALISQHRGTTATLLAHIAEADRRKLYLKSGYPSMYHYCVGELHMCEELAHERTQVAHTAREFPAIFEALADGRLDLHAVLQLRPHLTTDTADELLAAAATKTNAEIEMMLARRFPQADAPTELAPAANDELAARPVSLGGTETAREPFAAPDATLE